LPGAILDAGWDAPYTEDMETEKGYQKLDGESRRTAERLLRRLREAGHSSTRPRRAVVQVLACAKSCLSPAEILTRGQAFHPPLGLVTVYRTLDVLSDLRLVRKVHLPNGCHSYALAECPHGTMSSASAVIR
jgi:Fe2+ or Zn2+ uptake regulation protein